MQSKDTSPRNPPARLAVAALCLVAACAPRESVFERQLIAFSTVVNVRIFGADPDVATAAVAAMERLFTARDRDWYAWGDGELGALNRALRDGTEGHVSAELGALLQRARALRASSGGRFDPAAGALSELWRFRDFAAGAPPGPPPDPASIEAAARLAAAGYTLHRESDRWRVSTIRPGVQIDPGGIAKGALLRDGIAVLARHGIRTAILDIGGDLYALGDTGRGPYRIGVRGPERGAGGLWLALHGGEAVATSGDYERFWEHGGRRYGHILDPRSGRPAATASMATVIHADPLLADAAATALIVGGPAEFGTVCDAMGIERALLVDNGGAMMITPGMRERLHGPGADR